MIVTIFADNVGGTAVTIPPTFILLLSVSVISAIATMIIISIIGASRTSPSTMATFLSPIAAISFHARAFSISTAVAMVMSPSRTT